MAENTLTNLIPDIYSAMDYVSRELTGYIPAVARNASASGAAVGEAVRYHIAPTGNGVNITPAMAIPEPTEQTIGSDTITMTKARAYEFGFVGEAERGLNNGPGAMSVQADMIAQAIRGLVNEVEVDIAVAAAAGVSRAAGTAGTTPFASDTSGVSDVRKVLVDNGSPTSDLQLVLDTTAGAKLRTLYGINTDRDWSQVSIRDQGVLVSPHGVAIRETGQPQSHTKGTASSATTNNAGYAVGATTITLASAGTGTILAGDVITFAGDTNQYVVVTGDADVSGGGTIVIQEPGLRVAMSAATKAITVVANHTKNVAFHRNAIVLATRAPAVPNGGDQADERRIIVDPRSGMALEFSRWGGYRKARYEVAAVWGVKVTQPRHTAALLG